MASAAVKKPINSNKAGISSSSKVKVESTSIGRRNVETSNRQQSVDTKNKSVATKTVKSEEKGKATTTSTSGVKKREKKVYSLSGQKYDVPEEREPLSIFYESLSKQIPTSEMAEFWMMEHGLLSPERAKRAYEKKQRKQKQQRMGTPIKSPPPSLSKQQRMGTPIKSPPPSLSKPESSNRQKPASKPASKNGDTKAKRRIVEDSDDDFIGSPKRRKA